MLDLSMTLGRYLWIHILLGLNHALKLTAPMRAGRTVGFLGVSSMCHCFEDGLQSQTMPDTLADINSNNPVEKGMNYWMVLPIALSSFCSLPYHVPTQRMGTIHIHSAVMGLLKATSCCWFFWFFVCFFFFNFISLFFSSKVGSSILIMLRAYQITLSKYAVALVINAAAGVGPFWR